MQVLKSSSFMICLSAFLLILGTCFAVVEVPVRITYESLVAEQYDLMRAFMPLGIVLYAMAFILLTYGVLLGLSKRFTKQLLHQKLSSRASAIVALALGSLAIASVFLPWMIVERTEPLVATRRGLIDVGRYHSLTGINLMTGVNNMVGDVLLFALAGALISIIYIPLVTLIEEKAIAVRTLLFLLSGLCIVASTALIYMHRTWWICLQIDGSLGFSTILKAPGIGLLTALSSAIGLMASGVIIATK